MLFLEVDALAQLLAGLEMRHVLSRHLHLFPRFGVAPGYPTTLSDIEALKPILTNVSTRFRGAETLARELVTLPTHSQTSERDRRRAFEVVCVGRAKHSLLPVAQVRQNRRLEQRV